jgi:hypothetical protein
MLYLFYNLYKNVTYFGMEEVVANEYDPMPHFIIRYTLIMLYLFYNLYKNDTYFGMEEVVANEYDPMPHFPTPFKSNSLS